MTNSITQNSGRFDYVKYDDFAVETTEAFKTKFQEIEAMIDRNIVSPRAKALVLTNLEQAYMWVGKGVRDDQLARQNGAGQLGSSPVGVNASPKTHDSSQNFSS